MLEGPHLRLPQPGRQLIAIVKAIQTLQYLIRDPFGTVRADTAS
jgi:hypothetical protein